jgi:Protein of unknown function (DUF1761)
MDARAVQFPRAVSFPSSPVVEEVPLPELRVRQNYWAILVATVASFGLAAVWYQTFMQPWLEGVGRTMEWFKNSGVPTFLPPVVAFVMAGLMATAISHVTQLTGAQTAGRGIRVGLLLWLGFVCTVLGTEYMYEVRPRLFLLNAGYWLISMVVTGAIVGGWKKLPAGGTARKPAREKVVAG